jgi:catechol 2,3-dioxygenase-like lactoylglutathione lyase family enzyme
MRVVLKVTKSAVDVGIVVADLAGQRRFYGELLGLPYVGLLPVPGGEVHIYLFGDSLLKLYRMGEGAPANSVQEFGSRAGLAYITLTISDLEAAFSRLEAGGATVLARPDIFDGGVTLDAPVGRMRARYALLTDVDGNMIELFEYLDQAAEVRT